MYAHQKHKSWEFEIHLQVSDSIHFGFRILEA